MTANNIFDLTDRNVLITGGSRGLGRAFAEGVASFGANVAIAARNEDKINETLDILSGYKVKTLGIPADMTKEEDIERMVEKTVTEFGSIDVLFNNAGIARPLRTIHEEVMSDYDAVIATNLRAPFMVLKHVLPVMMKQNKGSIINTSSIAGINAAYPAAASVAYAASKAGINIMTKIAALDYAQYNIRVNCIAPGLHESEIGHDRDMPQFQPSEEMLAIMKEKQNKVLDDIPMKRFGKADEIIGLAVLLASDASSYITGQIIIQDGGRTIKH
ncbi:MAG: SDR family oxidoreductase [Dehalococcoidales bacterium]|nr:SDR family oxidoreductase [Dehalococcoidales bacterium]